VSPTASRAARRAATTSRAGWPTPPSSRWARRASEIATTATRPGATSPPSTQRSPRSKCSSTRRRRSLLTPSPYPTAPTDPDSPRSRFLPTPSTCSYASTPPTAPPWQSAPTARFDESYVLAPTAGPDPPDPHHLQIDREGVPDRRIWSGRMDGVPHRPRGRNARCGRPSPGGSSAQNDTARDRCSYALCGLGHI
jgi:hypothetical protein